MATTYLTRTSWGTATNRQKFTQSFWVKRGVIGLQQALLGVESGGNNEARVLFRTDDTFEFYDYQSGYTFRYITNRKFRDCSAWYNIVLRVDTDNGTAANRVRIYINGVQETSFSTGTQPSRNLNTFYNSSGNHIVQIGRQSTGNSYFTGSMSHVNFLDGEDRDGSFFGSTDATTGEWKIKTTPSGVNYGTNGYFILKDGNTITDSSANSNNFSLGGGTLTATKDCPSNVMATLNVLAKPGAGNLPSFANGNTHYNKTATGSGNNSMVVATLGATTGKFYYEYKMNDSNAFIAGISKLDGTYYDANGGSMNTSQGVGVAYQSSGNKIINGTSSSYGSSYGSGNIIGVAFDLVNNFIYFSKNGTFQNSGNPTSGSSGTGGIAIATTGITYSPFAQNNGYNSASSVYYNFGNGYFGTTAVTTNSGNGYAGAEGASKFNYAVPSGYSALSTKGLNT